MHVNKLTFNVAKTQMMIVSRKCRESELNGICITVGEPEIERKKCVKSLGAYLDDSLISGTNRLTLYDIVGSVKIGLG